MQLNDGVSNSTARSYSHVKEVVKHELSGRFRHTEETLKKLRSAKWRRGNWLSLLKWTQKIWRQRNETILSDSVLLKEMFHFF